MRERVEVEMDGEALELTGKALSGELAPIAGNLKIMIYISQCKTPLMDLKITEEEVNTNQRSGDCTIL